MEKNITEIIEKANVKQLEEKMIFRCLKGLNKKKMSRRDEKLLSLTLRLIEITHGPSFLG